LSSQLGSVSVGASVIAASMEAFATAAHGASSPGPYLVMFTPAFDLYAGQSTNKYDAFIGADIAQNVALWEEQQGYADYYEIQAQGEEGNIGSTTTDPSYVYVVYTIYNQINGENPDMLVTAGLSNHDNDSGDGFTATEIVNSVNAISTTVPGIAGYWPNDVYPPPTPSAGTTPEPNPGNTPWDSVMTTLSGESPQP
jgi:hypothetical protein